MVDRPLRLPLWGGPAVVDAGGDEKPERELPERAWLARAEDDDTDAGPPWVMTVEHGDRGTDHAGEYDELLEIAYQTNVAEFYVFDSASSGFHQLRD